MSLSLCPLDPGGYCQGAAVPDSATVDLVGDSTEVAAESGQVGQITWASARLNVPNAAAVDVPFDLTALLLNRAEPVPAPG